MIHKMKCPVQIALFFLVTMSSPLQAADVFKDYNPPGQWELMFESFRLYIHCEGEGELTVLIEPGIGDSLANWIPIQGELSQYTKVCLYDRAGNGLSDPGPGPRIASQITLELYSLLKQINIEGPYILIGHSFGGYIAQFFAGAFPDETAGLVLVDSSHWDQVTRLAELDEIQKTPGKIGGYKFEDQSLLTSAQRLWKHLNAQRKAVWTQMDELGSFRDSADEVNKILNRLPTVPMAVLSRGRTQLPTIPGKKSMEAEWQSMQKDLTSLSEQSWQVIVSESGHSIHQEAPDVIVENTLKVIQLARVNEANVNLSP